MPFKKHMPSMPFKNDMEFIARERPELNINQHQHFIYNEFTRILSQQDLPESISQYYSLIKEIADIATAREKIFCNEATRQSNYIDLINSVPGNLQMGITHNRKLIYSPSYCSYSERRSTKYTYIKMPILALSQDYLLINESSNRIIVCSYHRIFDLKKLYGQISVLKDYPDYDVMKTRSALLSYSNINQAAQAMVSRNGKGIDYFPKLPKDEQNRLSSTQKEVLFALSEGFQDFLTEEIPVYGTNAEVTLSPSITASSYQGSRNSKENDVCSICFDPMDDNLIMTLPCQHQYHAYCLVKMIHQNNQKGAGNKCPLCRAPF